MNESGSKKTVVCEECRLNPYIYKCPRCSFRSCSLSCCQSHKQRTRCSGKRDRTAFVPVRDMTDATLQSDYHFLEDVLGQVDNGKKLWKHGGGAPPKRIRIDSDHALLRLDTTPPTHPKLRELQRVAASKSIQILFQPQGMQRRTTNRSFAKGSVIHWTVEVCLHGVDKSIQRDLIQVPDDMNLQDALTVAHFLLPAHHNVVTKKIPCPSHQPLYVQVDCRTNHLANALQDLTVIEYPTLEVIPIERLAEFPLAIESLDAGSSEE